jgi:peptidoglycan/xylan/chitin deacetylase (PgdA/CDA1 family)
VDDTGSLLSLTAAQLRSHLALLRKGGWRGLTAGQYLARFEEDRSPQREVLLTFDDGFENFYTHAAPVLAEFGFPATVFVVTDQVGRKPIWFSRDSDQIERLMAGLPLTRRERAQWAVAGPAMARMRLLSWDQARELVRCGFDVQSHSAAHHFLTGLPADELTADLRRSRQRLREELGVSAELLCYPYGDCNDHVVAVGREVGFRAGFLAEYPGPSRSLFRLGRIGMHGAMRSCDLRFALSTAMDRQAALRRWAGGLLTRLATAGRGDG